MATNNWRDAINNLRICAEECLCPETDLDLTEYGGVKNLQLVEAVVIRSMDEELIKNLIY